MWPQDRFRTSAKAQTKGPFMLVLNAALDMSRTCWMSAAFGSCEASCTFAASISGRSEETPADIITVSTPCHSNQNI